MPVSRRDALKALGLFAGASIPLATSSCSTASPRASSNADFYVAVGGSDTWTGTRASPNGDASDGPFATLARARDAVRSIKNKSPDRDVVVNIRGGFYPTSETVVFGVEDSGSGAANVTYAAHPGETPVFSSGKVVTDWKKVTGNLPGLPDSARGKVWVADVEQKFFTLFDSDGMLPRARSEGFIPLQGGQKDLLRFPSGRLKNWSNLEDVELFVRPHHAWIVNILPLKSVDENAQVARTSIPASYAMNELHFLKGTESCWVENVLEELSSPGEWVLNSQEGKLYLWPRDEKQPEGILAPTLQELIRVEGGIDTVGPVDVPVRNLRFRGLTFMHGDRYRIAPDDVGLQHDWDMHDKGNALVRFRGAEHCVIESCRFAHSGGGGIRVDLHGQDNAIRANTIEYLGGTGVLLCGYGPGTKDCNKRNTVVNNHVQHIGRIYSHSPGIMVWQSGENRVANNLLHHTPYTGIIISGCMDHFFARVEGRELARTIRWHEVDGSPRTMRWQESQPYLHSRDNAIEFNEIHHAMEELGDGNAIYIRAAGAGNVIRRNYVHHLVAPMLMQAAIRTDGGQRDTLISENVIYKCISQGIILKLNNHCVNNVVIDVIAPPRGYYLSLREGPMKGAIVQRNIFYSSSAECSFINELPPGDGQVTEDRRGRLLARSKDTDSDFNIFYCAADSAKGDDMLSQQQADGVDANSLALDPLFRDPANGDFRLQPDSPAHKLGIVAIDVRESGLLSN